MNAQLTSKSVPWTRPARLVLALTGLASAASVACFAAKMVSARPQAHAAATEARAQVAACNELSRLLADRRSPPIAPRSSDSLVTAVRAALRDAGLPDTRLKSQQSLPDEAGSTGPAAAGSRRQS